MPLKERRTLSDDLTTLTTIRDEIQLKKNDKDTRFLHQVEKLIKKISSYLSKHPEAIDRIIVKNPPVATSCLSQLKLFDIKVEIIYDIYKDTILS